jgi:hypothetical protein
MLPTATTPMLYLTQEMLRYGLFNHLPDEDLAYIRQLILELQQRVPPPHWHPIVDCWYRANFNGEDFPAHLIHDCNAYLMRMRLPLLEISFVEYPEG